MPIALTGAVEELVRQQMASGKYVSENELLARALRLLAEYDETVTDLRAGLEDENAGRLRPLRDVDAELRQKCCIPHLHGAPFDISCSGM